MSTKLCFTCNNIKSLNNFHKSSKSLDGYRSKCKSCRKQTEKSCTIYKKLHYENNRDLYISRAINHYYNNIKTRQEQIKARYKKIKDTIEYKNQYKAYSAQRRADTIKRTPVWADLNEIEQIYRNCPEGYHVDHIIPLKGKNISGLHIKTNLQYLPAVENLKKHNKFEVTNV